MLTGTNYALKNRCLNINNENSYDKQDGNSYTLEEQAIINMIRDNPFINPKDIADKIGKSLRMTKIYTSKMQEKGLIKRENGKRNGKWIIV